MDSTELKDFLEKSKRHVAVLTEWPIIEALNGDDPVSSLKRRFALCESHQPQFVILREAHSLVKLSGRQAGLVKRMLEPESKAKLASFLETIANADRGDTTSHRGILERKSDAEAFLDRFLESAGEFTKWYSLFQTEYSETELKLIRKNEPYSRSLWEKLTVRVRDLTGYFLANKPGTTKWPRPLELPNTFFYRLALMLQLHFFDWIASGSPKDRSVDKFRNDQIDVLIGVTATYFDGLITKDRKLQRIHDQAVWFLENYSIPLARLVEANMRARNI